jgi:hypothetical protein
LTAIGTAGKRERAQLKPFVRLCSDLLMLLVGGLHDVIEHGVEGTLCTNRTSVEIFKPRAPRPSG